MNSVKESPNSNNCRAEAEQRGSHLCPAGPSLRLLKAACLLRQNQPHWDPLQQNTCFSPVRISRAY